MARLLLPLLLLAAAAATTLAQQPGCRSRYCPAVTGQARVETYEEEEAAFGAMVIDADAVARGHQRVWEAPLGAVTNWTKLVTVTERKPKLAPRKFEEEVGKMRLRDRWMC